MKPTTKKINQKKVLNRLKKTKNNPKIRSYFKSAPKPSIVEDENDEFANRDENFKAVYTEALKKKLQNMDNERSTKENETEQEDGAYAVIVEEEVQKYAKSNQTQIDISVSQNASKCAGCVEKTAEINDWEAKYKNQEIKYKNLQKKYFKSTARFSELDLKYNDLLKTVTHKNQPNIEHPVACSDEVFSANEVKALKRIAFKKSNDSTFILQGLKYAYKNNLSVMSSKSLHGKPEMIKISEDGVIEEIAKKDPLTPKKVERIRELFIERLSLCEIDSVQYGERIKEPKINQLFASGIKNIAKKHI